MSFQNKVAVITGASSGLGWSLAKQLAAQGAKVGLVARKQDRLEALAKEIEEAGGQAAWAAADVTLWEPTKAAMASLQERLGPVDLLIANAGVSLRTGVDPPNPQRTTEMFQVNVLGMVHAIDAVLPDMLARRSGHVAGVSSMAAYKGIPGKAGYCASKAAVNTYLEALRIQLRKRGVTVTTICPGFIKTPMTDKNEFGMPFMLDVDDAARRILRALARRRKVYNFPKRMSMLMKLIRVLPDRTVHRIFRRLWMQAPD